MQQNGDKPEETRVVPVEPTNDEFAKKVMEHIPVRENTRLFNPPTHEVATPQQQEFVQTVPDHCDRIVWRGHYYHLPLAAQPQEELVEVCAEAYQVVGSLLSDVGALDTDKAEKILDNLGEQRMIHKDVLPWPSFAQPQEEPEAELGNEMSLDDFKELLTSYGGGRFVELHYRGHLAFGILVAEMAEGDSMRQVAAEIVSKLNAAPQQQDTESLQPQWNNLPSEIKDWHKRIESRLQGEPVLYARKSELAQLEFKHIESEYILTASTRQDEVYDAPLFTQPLTADAIFNQGIEESVNRAAAFVANNECEIDLAGLAQEIRNGKRPTDMVTISRTKLEEAFSDDGVNLTKLVEVVSRELEGK